jgi:hypothetical protein
VQSTTAAILVTSLALLVTLVTAASCRSTRSEATADRYEDIEPAITGKVLHRAGCGIGFGGPAQPEGSTIELQQVFIDGLAGNKVYEDRLLRPRVEPWERDLDADGEPDGLLVGLRDEPRRPRSVFFSCSDDRTWVVVSDNEYGFGLADDVAAPDHLMTWQDGFQQRKELLDIHHYDSQIPPIIVRIEAGRIVDATIEFESWYSEIARDALAEVTDADRRVIASGPRDKLERFDRGVARGKFLRAIVALIYARRAAEARDVLDRDYPGEDKDAFWEAIRTSVSESTIVLDPMPW